MHPFWELPDSDLRALTECGMRLLAAVGLAVNLSNAFPSRAAHLKAVYYKAFSPVSLAEPSDSAPLAACRN